MLSHFELSAIALSGLILEVIAIWWATGKIAGPSGGCK